MSTETEFLERWRNEEPLYAAWGRYVASKLTKSIQSRVAPTKLEMFLKLPVVPRVKEADSMLQKAFYREKGYEDPYGDIEDKVGLRFVVLLSEDIRTIEAALKDEPEWIATLARDFEAERDQRPYEFDYQSLHYVVRPAKSLEFEGITIPLDIPCEIQIRTLLQHAYSELTHDTIYKPNVRTTPALKRTAAKSMALIEATGDYFSSVHTTIQHAVARTKRMAAFLADRYASDVNLAAADSPLNSILIDHYSAQVPDTFEAEFESWWKTKGFLSNQISARSKTTALYRTPSILLLYFCVSRAPVVARQESPLTDKELQPIYSDLGLAMHGL